MTSNLVVTCGSDNYYPLLETVSSPEKTHLVLGNHIGELKHIGKLEMVNVIAEQLFQYCCAAPNGFPWSPNQGACP